MMPQSDTLGRTLLEPREITLHGHRVSYRAGGSGPLLVLVHGIAGSGARWGEVLSALAEQFTVVAPDLLGHGDSAKPRGDYSLGAYACALRDLFGALGYERGTILGHSLGGGVAMQFAYQFPERCERLVLVSSGGLGHELHVLLRSAALPGAEWVLPMLCSSVLRGAVDHVAGLLGRVGLRAGPDLEEIWWNFSTLSDPEARQAFLHTVRTLIDFRGQRASATDRLYLAADLPTLIIWGEHDPLIPVAHAHAAHQRVPHSRLEIFRGAGHFPYRNDPQRFVRVLVDFMQSTAPARVNEQTWRERLRRGAVAC